MAVNTANGKAVAAGTHITILGTVTSITGSGPAAVVTVVDNLGNSFTAPARDIYGPQTEGPAVGAAGKKFSVGDRVSIPAYVTATSGDGVTATLSVQTSSVAQASTAKSPVASVQTVAAKSTVAPHK